MEQTVAINNYFIEIDSTEQICYVRGSGIIDFQKTMDAIEEVVETLRIHPNYKIIAEMQSVTYHPTFNEIMAVKNQITALKKILTNKIAIITQGRLTIIADMVCAFANISSIKMKSFNSEEEALKWISS